MQKPRAPALPQLTTRQIILPLAIAFLCIWVLQQKIGPVDVAQIWHALARVSPTAWALAALATCASFWAVGRYDTVLHRHFETGVPTQQTVQSGAAAIALSQVLGCGLVTGSFARWRILPQLGAPRAVALTLLCALSFMLALGLITALSALFLQPSLAHPWAWPLALLLLGVPLFALVQPNIVLPGRLRLQLPSLPAMGALLALTFVDTLFAALAFLLLLPAGSDIGLSVLYPAFLMALGAGLLSGAPAGAGPFELTLLALLPGLPEADLLAGLIGFRLLYYVLPAALAALLLLRPLPQLAAQHPTKQPVTRRILAHAARAELGVMRQTKGYLLQASEARLCVVKTPQTLTALFDPASGTLPELVSPLLSHARLSNRVPAVYKCSAQSAVALRRRGFRVLHIANEARIDPRQFNLASPAYRQLRRKLRRAKTAGVTVRRPAELPITAMQKIDASWVAAHGRARSFSMGRFCPAYLSHQRVYLAYQNDILVAFASFHTSAHEICLDLMRSSSNAPDGTMHALLASAIEEAAQAGRRQVSLAAVPHIAAHIPLRQRLLRVAGAEGLTQFKSCFNPRFVPLYMAAPSFSGLLIALCDLARHIHRGYSEPTS